MSSNNGQEVRDDGNGDGLAELDALVRAELIALSSGPSRGQRGMRANRQRSGATAARTPDRKVVVTHHWDSRRAMPDPERRHDGDESDCCAGDEGPFEAAVMRGMDDDLDLRFDDDPSATEDGMFTLEERHFIERTVKWLNPRDNKDLIVSRIWALLTDADPSDFYEPQAPDEDPLRGQEGSQLEPLADQDVGQAHRPNSVQPPATPRAAEASTNEDIAPTAETAPSRPSGPKAGSMSRLASVRLGSGVADEPGALVSGPGPARPGPRLQTNTARPADLGLDQPGAAPNPSEGSADLNSASGYADDSRSVPEPDAEPRRGSMRHPEAEAGPDPDAGPDGDAGHRG